MTIQEATIEYNRLIDKYHKAQLLFDIEQDEKMKKHIHDTIPLIEQKLYDLEQYIISCDEKDDYEVALDDIEFILE